MKNRDEYIIKRNEYDLMMSIKDNGNCCPIRAVSGTLGDRVCSENCSECVQTWLNAEAKHGEPSTVQVDKYAKAKELLKIAVENMRWIEKNTVDINGGCLIRKGMDCGNCPFNISGSLDCKWKWETVALSLIEENF